jgi:hypothetical protein
MSVLYLFGMEYEVSIRINFPVSISDILRKEKERFMTEYGSDYRSEPHITLYLDRYTQEGFSRLAHDLKELKLKPFSITLGEVKARPGPNLRNLYVVDFSDKDKPEFSFQSEQS